MQSFAFKKVVYHYTFNASCRYALKQRSFLILFPRISALFQGNGFFDFGFRRVFSTTSNFTRMKESNNQQSAKSEPVEHSNGGPKGFRWDNRTRTSTAVMIVWSIGVAIYIIKRRRQRDEEFHKAMLEDSLSYMSDEEKNKILAKLKSKGITDIKVPEDK